MVHITVCYISPTDWFSTKENADQSEKVATGDQTWVLILITHCPTFRHNLT